MKAAFHAASLIVGLYATTAMATPALLTDAQLQQVVAGQDFTIVNKVADQASVGAPTTDPLLLNPWGLSQAPGGPLWVANNHSGTSTIYNFTSFAKVPLTVTIPGVDGGAGSPTGTVFTNKDPSSFKVSNGATSGHSVFLFDTEDGGIFGWAPSVDPANALKAVDLSRSGASFKGMTIAENAGSDRIFAADFANNQVDMFNNQFQMTGQFTDPALPQGYAPFNVQTLGGHVYVAFAVRGSNGDEVAGAGLGYVVEFNAAGQKVKTLVSGGPLNAPWGLTIAPASFGKFAGALLVGNFGDGKINAFDPATGAFLGALDNAGTPLSINGLWALRNGPDGSVVFSAGSDDENHGLVGVIGPKWSRASWATQAHVTAPRR